MVSSRDSPGLSSDRQLTSPLRIEVVADEVGDLHSLVLFKKNQLEFVVGVDVTDVEVQQAVVARAHVEDPLNFSRIALLNKSIEVQLVVVLVPPAAFLNRHDLGQAITIEVARGDLVCIIVHGNKPSLLLLSLVRVKVDPHNRKARRGLDKEQDFAEDITVDVTYGYVDDRYTRVEIEGLAVTKCEVTYGKTVGAGHNEFVDRIRVHVPRSNRSRQQGKGNRDGLSVHQGVGFTYPLEHICVAFSVIPEEVPTSNVESGLIAKVPRAVVVDIGSARRITVQPVLVTPVLLVRDRKLEVCVEEEAVTQRWKRLILSGRTTVDVADTVDAGLMVHAVLRRLAVQVLCVPALGLHRNVRHIPGWVGIGGSSRVLFGSRDSLCHSASCENN